MQVLPDSPEALSFLLEEVKDFVGQMQTLQQMFSRRDSLLREVIGRGVAGPEPATARFLEQQREAIARHLASLRSPGDTFRNYLPVTAWEGLEQALEAYGPQVDRLSGADFESIIDKFVHATRMFLERLQPFRLLQQQIFERLVAVRSGAVRTQSTNDSADGGEPAPTDERKAGQSPNSAMSPSSPADQQPWAGLKVNPDLAETQDTESQVAAILRKDPRATSQKVAKSIGMSDKTVRNQEAWKENRKKLNEQKAQAGKRERTNHERVFEGIASPVGDPAEIAADRELVRRTIDDDDPEALQALHRIEYVIRTRAIEPECVAGNIRVFGAGAVERIAQILRDIDRAQSQHEVSRSGEALFYNDDQRPFRPTTH